LERSLEQLVGGITLPLSRHARFDSYCNRRRNRNTFNVRSSGAMLSWLPTATDYLGRWIEFQIRRLEQPGCVIAVAHRGQVVWEAAFGVADLRTGARLTPRHRFRVASHSKTFTAVGIMRLCERGTLHLDDEAGRYAPGLHPALAKVSVAQLLSHSAGIVRDGLTGDQWFGRRPFANDGELSAALSAAPVIESNTRFKYSNYAYGLVGRIIPVVTAEPYAAWITREVVTAAGLSETTVEMPSSDGIPLARGHSAKLPLGRRVVLPALQSTNALAPATGFVSTAGDLARFFARLLPSAETDLLTVDSRHELTRAHWRNPHSMLELHYGLGTMSGGKGEGSWFGNVGYIQGFLSRTAALPAYDLTVSVVANAIDAPANEWIAGALHIFATCARYGSPSDATRDWGGRWWSVWGPSDLVPLGERVLVANPALAMPFADASEITPTGVDAGIIIRANGFGSQGETVERMRNDDGQICAIRLAGGTLIPEERVNAELDAQNADARERT
jgi:CubicO group peptidase (beta-lactamase class C family)